MPDPLDPPPSPGYELAPGVRAPESAFRWQYARSSGPGGQNVNKVNTKAEFWLPLSALTGLSDRALSRLRNLSGKRLLATGELHIASDTHRTQDANRAAALDRLRELLVQALHEPKPRRKTKPSRGSRERRLQAKKRRSEIKSRRQGRE